MLPLTSAVSASFTLGKCHCVIDTTETPIAMCFEQKHLHLLVEHKSERQVPPPLGVHRERGWPCHRATRVPWHSSKRRTGGDSPQLAHQLTARGMSLSLINSGTPHRTKQTALCHAPGRLELGRSRSWARQWGERILSGSSILIHPLEGWIQVTVAPLPGRRW